MSLVSIPAIYDGERIRLRQTAPIEGPYHVLVTFIEDFDVLIAATAPAT